MSWSRPLRAAVASAAVLAVLAVGGCTVAPVHSAGDTAAVQLAYASPGNRLEQVFYQTLAARLGPSAPGPAPVVSASVSTSAGRVGLSERNEPATERQVVATVRYRIEKEGQVLASGQRTATAGYRSTGQILADDAARQRADEDAVRAAAHSVIAAILADPRLR